MAHSSARSSIILSIPYWWSERMHCRWSKTKPVARIGFVAGAVFLLMVGLLGMLAMIPAVSPTTGAQVADWIREVLGPRPVAFLENESLSIQDAFNRFIAALDGGQRQISLARRPAGSYGSSQKKPSASGK